MTDLSILTHIEESLPDQPARFHDTVDAITEAALDESREGLTLSRIFVSSIRYGCKAELAGVYRLPVEYRRLVIEALFLKGSPDWCGAYLNRTCDFLVETWIQRGVRL